MNLRIAPGTLGIRLLRPLAKAVRVLLTAVLVAWGLAVLGWGALHVWIVPRIDQWRPDLAQWATSALGVPVEIGALHADSGSPDHPLSPVLVLTLQEVRLLDARGQPALSLPQVRLALSAGSLLRGGFDQLVIEAPVLDVRRTPAGRLEVAGLDMEGPMRGRPPADGEGALDWLLRQPEFVIRQGRVRWLDERRAAPALELGEVNFINRNGRRLHQFRLDATPPPAWGGRFSLRARLREPLLPRAGEADLAPWQRWQGTAYADFGAVDLAQLRQHLDLGAWGLELDAGRGALRAWVDLEDGRPAGLTADLALDALQTRLAPDLPTLALQAVHGRLEARWDEARLDLGSPDLRWQTEDGHVWPGGAWRYRHAPADAGGHDTELQAERLDLGQLSALARRLPLPEVAHGWLQRLDPKGVVQDLHARWTLAPEQGLRSYQARGAVRDLVLRGEPSGLRSRHGSHPLPGRPGIEGATLRFEIDQDGGQAQLRVQRGVLELPGVFEDPRLALDRLEAGLRWRVQGEQLEVWTEGFRLANRDTEGTARARWRSGDPATSPSGSRFPGVLDLSATLTRADATRVHRYLPLTVGPEARRYVREAVRGGNVSRVDFRMRGEVYDMPFETPEVPGDFRISARLQGVDFDYVPPHLQHEGEPRWPMLRALQGELVLDRLSLKVQQIESGLDRAPGVRLTGGQIAIDDLAHTPLLRLQAQARGPAAELLAYLQHSPLDGMTGHALARAQASGQAGVDLRLTLPLMAAQRTTVAGTVQLAGNDLRLSPQAPLLAQASGSVSFDERGFRVSGARARLYGGEVRFEGGMVPDAQGVARVRFRGEGTASAEGLREAGWGSVSRLFAHARGQAAYRAELGFVGGEPELEVQSSLQGMGFNLPAPLRKAETETRALHYRSRVLAQDRDGRASHDAWELTLGDGGAPTARLAFERELRPDGPQPLRGSVALGDLAQGPTLPARGVVAQVRWPELDLDAWRALLPELAGAGASGDHLPQQLGLNVARLRLDGRDFHAVVLGLSQQGNTWRANVDADELSGYLEWRDAGSGLPGSLTARLARLTLPPSAAGEVERVLHQPNSVPALDLAVDHFVLGARALGRVEVQAVNRGSGAAREWRLQRLQLTVPEARLRASGNWVAAGSGGPRRTALAVELDIDDAGALLGRFGRAGVVRGGKGRLEGHLGWLGSPLALDVASLSGQLRGEVERGQFLKVEPGAAKLLGVLSLQALPRRLALDFRDVFTEGFTFDFIRGDATLDQGVMATNNLQMKGVNAAVLMEGEADIGRETQDLRVVVVPEINAGTASLIATAVNPAVGIGTFVAQFLLRQPLQQAATQHFHITGGWEDPQVVRLARQEAAVSDPLPAASAAPPTERATPP